MGELEGDLGHLRGTPGSIPAPPRPIPAPSRPHPGSIPWTLGGRRDPTGMSCSPKPPSLPRIPAAAAFPAPIPEFLPRSRERGGPSGAPGGDSQGERWRCRHLTPPPPGKPRGGRAKALGATSPARRNLRGGTVLVPSVGGTGTRPRGRGDALPPAPPEPPGMLRRRGQRAFVTAVGDKVSPWVPRHLRPLPAAPRFPAEPPRRRRFPAEGTQAQGGGDKRGQGQDPAGPLSHAGDRRGGLGSPHALWRCWRGVQR